MLTPFERFGQRRTVQWSAPLLSAFLWGAWAALRFHDPSWTGATAAGAALLSALWLHYLAAWSRFGSDHYLWSPWVFAAILLWPASQALTPAWLGADAGAVDLASLALHAGSLAGAALWHARAAPLPTLASAARHLDWPDMRIDLRRRTLTVCAHGERNNWAGGIFAASGSVMLYAWLKSRFELPDRLAIAAILMHAVSLYAYFGPLGRQLGQGLRLRQLEARLPGPPFSDATLKALEAARQRVGIRRILGR